jgi:hypothetical protein
MLLAQLLMRQGGAEVAIVLVDQQESCRLELGR